MARNGSGTYVKVGDNVVFDTVISETYYNNQINDLVAALTQSVSKDGQTTITGNLNMGSRKLTAMAVGTAATDSVSLAQVQAGAFGYVASDSGSSNAYVIAPSPAITGFAAGQKFAFLAANVSSGASTLNVSGLGVKNVYYQNAAISGAMIKAGALILVVYDGTQFQMLSPADTYLSGTVAIASGGTGATSAAAAATALGVGTGNSPQFTAVNVGAATDTTITRVSAGLVAVEGSTVATLAPVQTFVAAQRPTVTALSSSSAAIAITLAASNDFSHTFTENTTLSNPADTAIAGQKGSIYLTQHASSPKSLAFGSEYDFVGGTAPTITAANNARDTLDYRVRTDGKIEIQASLNYS
tara:strand:+ start:1642 stop:2709 length:1068 start_codon:yes stop_codon:yes gene_type:complete